MGRVVVASIVAAVLVFAWGWLAWIQVGMYEFAFRGVPHAETVVPTLESSISEPGTYYFPGMPEDQDDTAAMDAWRTQHADGPIGILHYRNPGVDPQQVSVYLRGFAIIFAGALLLACLVRASGRGTFGGRFGIAVLAALFVVCTSHASNWSWFHLPDAYSLAMSIDVVVAWLLAGAAVAAIVQPSLPAR
ncbi:MAG: hypothetical protein L0271_25230 [Gemmatimonadetes bacterium]|nr:hypothetical protein [Gemmatimonadota bacterium]